MATRIIRLSKALNARQVAADDKLDAISSEFDARLDSIIAVLLRPPARQPRQPKTSASFPGVVAALQEMGGTNLFFRARWGDIPTLKGTSRVNGIKLAKASQRCTYPDRFVFRVIHQTLALLKRRSAFLPANADAPAYVQPGG